MLKAYTVPGVLQLITLIIESNSRLDPKSYQAINKKSRNHIRDHTAETSLFIRRTLIAFFVVLLLFSILLINLYHLQVDLYDKFQTSSNNNRIKLIPISPTRGLIYDRNGKILALNNTTYQLEVIPGKVKNLQEQLDRLRSIIDLNEDDIAAFEKERKNKRRFASVTLKNHLSEEQIARFAVNQYDFPDFEIKGYQRRFYPYGAALTHILGYVSKINDKDLQWLTNQDRIKDYVATNDIGKLGIEKYYEPQLLGKPGYAEVEVNSRGRIIRKLSETPPQAGQNIYLTLDLDLQMYITKIMAGRRGAVIVSDPRNGEILAMVSSPSYDSNLFVDGISNKDFDTLRNDPDGPLFNRATQGTYPPASTVKPYIAFSALSEKVIDPTTTIHDPGYWRLPNSKNKGPCTAKDKNNGCYRDWSWRRGGQGTVSLLRAIESSSDTFFYQVAFDMGIDRLSAWMKQFSFGESTGIDIYEESKGLMPTREWKKKNRKESWFWGDTISVGIGQGYWKATPIQMIKALMTLINHGKVVTPHFLLSSQSGTQQDPYRDENQTQFASHDSPYWDYVLGGMNQVMQGAKGSAHLTFGKAPYKAGGKSGTAQVFGLNKQIYDACNLPENLRDHALFIAYAPFDKPTIAITLVIENALSGGGSTAAPIVRQIMDHMLLGEEYTPEPLNKCQ